MAAAAAVAGVARERSTLPLLFVYADPVPSSARIRKLAATLQACVIEPPRAGDELGLLATALLAIQGLVIVGLTGFDGTDYATLTTAPCVGHAAVFRASVENPAALRPWVIDALQEPGVTGVLLPLKCPSATRLESINDMFSCVSDAATDAAIMIATFITVQSTEQDHVEVGVVALQRC